MPNALERWYALHDARAQQMDAAYKNLGRTSSDFWDRRARGYHRAAQAHLANDPCYRRLRAVVRPEQEVLDVGAGTGRFALGLAPFVHHVVAVEPNTTMLGYLRRDAAGQELTNISTIQATWQEAPDDLRADLVICSHVLYPIRDIEPFLAKLRTATRQTCYLYLRATHIDELSAPIWRHFHGTERALAPSYIHALDILYEMGIYADLEVVRLPSAVRYASLDEAVEEMLEMQILPADTRTRADLRALLADWLVEEDGVLAPPVREMVSAIITFGP